MHERRLREVRAGVYVIECVATGQFYVGRSSNFDERKACHWPCCAGGSTITRACGKPGCNWVQYGEGAFTFRAVEIAGDLSLRRRPNAGMPRH